jgi:hypothetical protein
MTTITCKKPNYPPNWFPAETKRKSDAQLYFPDLNALPEIHENFDLGEDYVLPDFVLDVTDNTTITTDAKMDFYYKFFLRYVTSEKFRDISSSYFLVFSRVKYYGAYSDICKCLDAAHKDNVIGPDISIIPVTPVMIGRC